MFLERHKISKLTKKEMENMNRPITSRDGISGLKNLQRKPQVQLA